MTNPYATLTEYELRHLPAHLIGAGCRAELQTVLTDLYFLEAKAEAGMVFEMAVDFTRALQSQQADQPRSRVLGLLTEAICRDINFIHSHPNTIFQCLWNGGWWYNNPDPSVLSESLTDCRTTGNPLHGTSSDDLACLLWSWRSAKDERTPESMWLRSLCREGYTLAGPQLAHFRGDFTCIAWSPDGKYVAGGTRNGAVHFWDATTLASHASLPSRAKHIRDVAFSADGRLIAAVSWDDTVVVWDTAGGAELARFPGASIAWLPHEFCSASKLPPVP